MFAQINHVAIISHQYNTLGKFYEAVFGLKSSAKGRPASAITIGDGYAGLNLIPRRDGYVGGIDHFGMVVDDVEPVLERMKRKHKNAANREAASARPFAAYSGHDPDGNVFDLAQKKEDTRKEVYAEIAGGGWAQDRLHQQIRDPHAQAEECAEFYRDVFELEAVSRKSGTAAYCLTDGRVTLAILPWFDSGVRRHVGQAPGSGPYRLSCRESGRVQGAGRGSGRDESLSRRLAARRQPGIRCAQTLFRGPGERQMADVRSRRELDRYHDD